MKWEKHMIWRLLIVIFICLMTTPMHIKAEEKPYQFDYTVLNGKAYIDGVYGGNAATLIVPETIGQYTVAGIGNPHPAMANFFGLGFDDEDEHDEKDRYLIKKVVLPKTIEYVMEDFLGNNAGVEELVISDGANFQIPEYTYRDEQKDSIKKIYIGSSMTDATTLRLTYGRALEEIVVSTDNPVYKSRDGILFSKDMKTLLVCPTKKYAEKYVVPDGVRYIGVGFQCCQDIKVIQLPDSFEKADEYAFEKCSAQVIYPKKKTDENKTEDTLPKVGTKWQEAKGEAVYKIVSSDPINKWVVVWQCKKKATCIIPETIQINGETYRVIGIGAKAFYNNKRLVSVVIPDTVTQIGNNAFAGCTKLKTVTIGKGIRIIEKNAFKNCKSLKSLTIKGTKLRAIGKAALKGIHAKCKIKVPAKKQVRYKMLLKGKGQKVSVKVTK